MKTKVKINISHQIFKVGMEVFSWGWLHQGELGPSEQLCSKEAAKKLDWIFLISCCSRFAKAFEYVSFSMGWIWHLCLRFFYHQGTGLLEFQISSHPLGPRGSTLPLSTDINPGTANRSPQAPISPISPFRLNSCLVITACDSEQ